MLEWLSGFGTDSRRGTLRPFVTLENLIKPLELGAGFHLD